MILPIVMWLVLAAPQSEQDLTKLPAGCTLKTFSTVTPAGWFATTLQDSPEGREGCMYILFAKDKSPAAVMHVESIGAKLPLFKEGDPFKTLVNTIAEGLGKNMNVNVKDVTYRNDDLKRSPQSPFDRAWMAVFAAEVPGDPRPHEVVIAAVRGTEYFITVFVVTPSSRADPTIFEASTGAFREIMNSLNTVPPKR